MALWPTVAMPWAFLESNLSIPEFPTPRAECWVGVCGQGCVARFCVPTSFCPPATVPSVPAAPLQCDAVLRAVSHALVHLSFLSQPKQEIEIILFPKIRPMLTDGLCSFAKQRHTNTACG